MKVLMYGWEYPPYISGGLGVACHAIVHALTKKNILINLVLPHDFSSHSASSTETLVNLIGVDLYDEQIAVTSSNLINICQIDSLLHPYFSTNEYQNFIEEKNNPNQKNHKKKLIVKQTIDHHSPDFTPIKITACYGDNLFNEVLRYSEIAGRLAEQISHDVIHVHDWMTILAGIKAKSISKKPLIFHTHALEIDRSGTKNYNRQIFDIEKYGMEQADKVIAVSNYTKNIITSHYGIPANKIEVVYNGIEQSNIKHKINTKSSKTKMVLFLGRITQQKGPSFFIAIAKKILDKRKDVQFVIAGTGHLLAEMIEQVAALRIGKYVHFTGFLDQKTVKKIYQLADVYVMPSVSEPFGLSCLEALSEDVPVVISKQSGVAEALHNTLNADFWDTDDMAAKILAVLAYKGLGAELITNAKKEMEHLTWDIAGDKIISVYNNLTGS
ncbi:MAG: hypothetical protein A2X78_03585 [Gammaproteobacteria bacterium GWE2_37_16]|nr:MAG: hypothetical protein A2X78_03585 [Gammaproteobacteria bacterium GWE2_37_16]